MNIADLNNAALMFVGVNEGYSGEQMSLKDPEHAATVVLETITKARRFVGDTNEYKSMAGIAIYPEVWGCMLGGEPVAAVITNGDCASAIKMARYLQGYFRQDELTLAMFDEVELGEETLNFHALLDSSLKEFGTIWQRVAGEYHQQHGVYVSIGAYEVGNRIIISSQANHNFGVAFSDWELAAKAVCMAASEEMNKEIYPEFSQVRYTYLNKQDLQRYIEASRS